MVSRNRTNGRLNVSRALIYSPASTWLEIDTELLDHQAPTSESTGVGHCGVPALLSPEATRHDGQDRDCLYLAVPAYHAPRSSSAKAYRNGLLYLDFKRMVCILNNTVC